MLASANPGSGMKDAVGSKAGMLLREVPPRSSEYPPYFAGLYARSGGQKFGLSFEEFAAILREVSHEADPSEAAQVPESLRLEELALARACARANERAWECFLNRYRQKLYDMAGAIAKEESAARELADGIYAELFGTRQTAEGQRISKLASYTGRGSLEGWLRMVLVQEYVNRYRRQSRLVSFDEKIQTPLEQRGAAEPADPRLDQATDAALGELSSEERLLLASWYLDGRTLAEIGRMLGVHESTVSRRIEKITAWLRKRIVRGLRERGMDRKAAEEALKADVRDLTLDVRSRLAQGHRESNVL